MPSVLLIEDEELVRELLKEVLEINGFQVLMANDGIDGVRLFKESPTDIVITDLVMPEQEGVKTTLQIKKLAPHVKIIVISGKLETESMNSAPILTMMGADLVLKKPFKNETLLENVNALLATEPS